MWTPKTRQSRISIYFFFSIHGTKSLVFKADVKRLVFKAGVCGVKSVKHKKVTGARISPRSPRSPLDSATMPPPPIHCGATVMPTLSAAWHCFPDQIYDTIRNSNTYAGSAIPTEMPQYAVCEYITLVWYLAENGTLDRPYLLTIFPPKYPFPSPQSSRNIVLLKMFWFILYFQGFQDSMYLWARYMSG